MKTTDFFSISNRHASDLTNAEFFRAIVADLSNCGGKEELFEAIELEARFEKCETRKAIISAALFFAVGFEHSALTTLFDADVKGAYRMVRRLRIEIADNRMKWYLPARENMEALAS